MPNHYTGRNWDEVPWEKLGRGKRRERLLKETNYACSECGYNKRRPDGGVILEIDHIDGDPSNDAKENQRVLCPNCHALTPTFRNWGRRGHVKTSSRVRRGNKDFVPKV